MEGHNWKLRESRSTLGLCYWVIYCMIEECTNEETEYYNTCNAGSMLK